jgi:hypothetical protein
MGPNSGDPTPTRHIGYSYMEYDTAWGVHGGISLQSTRLLHDCFQYFDLEGLGTCEMQVLCLAHHPKPHVWTADRVAKRNWTHNPICPLCRREHKMAWHLLAGCRYSKRIWSVVAEWTALEPIHPVADVCVSCGATWPHRF